MNNRILVIEDVECLLKSVLDYLRDEGFAADGAPDGEEGFYKALNWDYDLIILDLMLPGLDGFEVMQKLKAAGRNMPVILLTARGAPPDRERGLAAGAVDYLVKPFEMDKLVERAREVIRRSESGESPSN